MPASLTKKPRSAKHGLRATRGLSPVISTIIITSVLLIILVSASFAATSILSAQIANTEFEQAKSNMQLLDETVQDVSLRPGSGSFVQFNNNEGGLGITQSDTSLMITVRAGGEQQQKQYSSLVHLTYAGAPMSTTAIDQSLGYSPVNPKRDNEDHLNVTMTQGLGFLRIEQDQGAKIKLDYDRIRITNSTIDDETNLVEISFIHLTKGSTSGSGPETVRVQNTNISPTTWKFTTGTIEVEIKRTNSAETKTQECTVESQATTTFVVFTEIRVEASAT